MKDVHEPRNPPPETGDTDAAPARPGGVSASRRRFTRAGLSASVMMTLASRPALANHCSVSGHMSGNLSRPHAAVCYGLTPGYWKTHPEDWNAAGYEPGMCNPITRTNGECKDWWFVTFGELQAAQGSIPPGQYSAYKTWANWVDGVTPASALPQPSFPPTTLGEAFAGSGLTFTDPNQTMMQAFWDPPEDPDPRTLVAHACAALLNVGRFGEESFGYTRAGLLQFIRDWTGSMEELKNALESLNTRSGS